MMKRLFEAIVLMGALMLGAASAHAERTLVTEGDIPAPVSDVWEAFTTAEGFMSWCVPKAEFDFRVGGEMRTAYNPASNLHDEHTIVNRVLAFEPERMLAMQNVQAPRGFANAEMFQDTWSVVYFDAVSPSETHVRIVGMGYGEGEAWDAIYKKFEAGNAYTLDQLRKKFAKEENSASAELPAATDVLSKLIGGEWIYDGTSPDGGVFRVRNVLSHGPDGVSLVGKGWLGDESGMFEHGTTIVYRQPGTGKTMFFNVDEQASVSQGEIQTTAADTVQWHWKLHAINGQKASFNVTMKFTDDDHYTFTLKRQMDDGAWQQMVDIEFERVAKAPPEMLKMRASAAHE